MSILMGLRCGMFYPIRHVDLRSGMSSTMRNVGIRSDKFVSNQACRTPIRHVGLWSDMLVYNESPTRHVGLRWRMSVTAGSPINHVSLQWDMSVFDGACQSLMKHVKVSDGSSIRHVGPHGSLIRHVDLQWVSDRPPIIMLFSWTHCFKWSSLWFQVNYSIVSSIEFYGFK